MNIYRRRAEISRNLNKLETRLSEAISLHNAQSIQLNSLAKLVEAERIELHLADIAIIAENAPAAAPVNFYSLSEVTI